MRLITSLATNDIYEFLEIENTTTVQKAMNGVSISNLSKSLKKKDIIKSISFFILRFNENFNASGKFTDMQIATVSMDLFEVFKYESLEDVMLMFKYARIGKIGDGRDFKLDSQTIFHKWVPAYLELKSEQRENEHNKSKGEKNGLANFNWSEEDVKMMEISDGVQMIQKGLGERFKEKLHGKR